MWTRSRVTIISKSKWILRLVKLRLVRLFLIVAVIGFYLGTRPWYLGGFAKPPIFSTITDPRPGATGTLEVLVPAAEWDKREVATRDLAANQHGCGRELFVNFRANAIGAEQGGSTFGSTLPGPVEACQT